MMLLDELAVNICNTIGITGPSCSTDKIQELKVFDFNYIYRRWSITYACIIKYLEGLAMYLCHVLVDLSGELHQNLIMNSLVLTNIQVKRDNRNNAADNLLAILSYELIKTSTAAYSKHVVDKYF